MQENMDTEKIKYSTAPWQRVYRDSEALAVERSQLKEALKRYFAYRPDSAPEDEA